MEEMRRLWEAYTALTPKYMVTVTKEGSAAAAQMFRTEMRTAFNKLNASEACGGPRPRGARARSFLTESGFRLGV